MFGWSVLEVVSIQQFATFRAENLVLVNDVSAVIATIGLLFLSFLGLLAFLVFCVFGIHISDVFYHSIKTLTPSGEFSNCRCSTCSFVAQLDWQGVESVVIRRGFLGRSIAITLSVFAGLFATNE